MDNKGQMTIVAVLMIFITLMVFVFVYPAFWEVVEPQLDNIENNAVVVFIQLSPFLMVIAIFMSIIWYISPQREQYR